MHKIIFISIALSGLFLSFSTKATDVPSLDPANRGYLQAFCAFHPTSPICIVKPNPPVRTPYTPPDGGGSVPGIPGPGGPGIPPVPFAGCGTQANLCYPPTGKSVAVSGAGQLPAALSGASPGDHLVLAGGNYGGSYTISKSGTEGNPIVIQPASGANVVFTGTLNMKGNYIVVSRLRVQGGKINISGHHNRITRVGFSGTRSTAIEINGGPHLCNRIDHNEFKSFVGWAIEISAMHNASQHQGHRIDHNYFFDHHVGSSEEVARMLTDAYRDSYLTYDYNLFDRVLQGERHQAEAVSVKTARTLLLGNTITNSGNASLVLRESNRSTVQNNYLDGGAKVEIMGDDNIVKGNTVTGGGALIVRGGDGTMDTTRAGCLKSGITPVLANCKGAHAAARRTIISDNLGKIIIGDLYSGNTFKAQDTTGSNNSGPIELQAGQTNTHVTTGNPSPAARKLTPADVGFSVGDSSCSGN